MEWDPALYNEKHAFVAEYGKSLLDFVPADREQTILDLGCGTGALTARLAALGRRALGVDSSRSMIDRARQQFGGIEFMVCDALALPFEREWDVIFSNAVFHWISDHDALLGGIRRALRPGGLLICEFGARGNIAAIENAFAAACRELGRSYQPKFNFPAAEDFSRLLEANGFVIEELCEYDRPTVLANGELGLANWLTQFFADELAGMPEDTRAALIKRVDKLTRASLWRGETWVADYRRLRAVAHI